MSKKIKSNERPSGSRVAGIGVYRPKRIVLNSEIMDKIDSSDEWIRERSYRFNFDPPPYACEGPVRRPLPGAPPADD